MRRAWRGEMASEIGGSGPRAPPMSRRCHRLPGSPLHASGNRLRSRTRWPALLVASAVVGAQSAAAEPIRAMQPAPAGVAPPPSGTGLQAVLDGLVSTAFLGGADRRKRGILRSGAALTVAPPRGPTRTYVGEASKLAAPARCVRGWCSRSAVGRM
jgi:hypothetical protein